MKQEEEKWVSAFRKCLEDYSEPPRADGWKRLERELLPIPIASTKRLYFMYASAAAAILLLVTSAAVILLLGDSSAKYTEIAKSTLASNSYNASEEKDNTTTSKNGVNYRNSSSSRNELDSRNITTSRLPTSFSDKNKVVAEENIENSQQKKASKLTNGTNTLHTSKKTNERKSEANNSKSNTGDNNESKSPQQNIRKVPGKEERTTELRDIYRKKSNKNFSIGLIAGNSLSANKGDGKKFGDVSGTNPPLIWEHDLPILFGLSIRKQLSRRFALESGVTYSRLESEAVKGSGRHRTEFKQTLHYIGIPLKFNYLFLDKRYVTLYLSGGGMVEKSISGKTESTEYPATITSSEDLDVKHPQWSVNGALGAQFNVTSQLGIFAEPGVIYYFDDKSEVETIRKETPFNFNLQLGLRFTY